jgi:anti-anti-sigma regulatory factor
VAVVVIVLGPYARFIPKSVLAGLLFIIAARLIDWRRLGYAIRASRFDAALVAVTAFTPIFIDVEDSILVGVALSILLFVPRASRPAMREHVIRERRSQDEPAKSLLIYDLEGELFFGAAPQLDRFLNEITATTDRTGIKYVVLRLKRTWYPDVVAVEQLERFLNDADRRGVTLMLAGIRLDFLRLLENVGLTTWFPADQIFLEEDEAFSATLRAVRHANQLANGHRANAHMVPMAKQRGRSRLMKTSPPIIWCSPHTWWGARRKRGAPRSQYAVDNPRTVTGCSRRRDRLEAGAQIIAPHRPRGTIPAGHESPPPRLSRRAAQIRPVLSAACICARKFGPRARYARDVLHWHLTLRLERDVVPRFPRRDPARVLGLRHFQPDRAKEDAQRRLRGIDDFENRGARGLRIA